MMVHVKPVQTQIVKAALLVQILVFYVSLVLIGIQQPVFVSQPAHSTIEKTILRDSANLVLIPTVKNVLQIQVHVLNVWHFTTS